MDREIISLADHNAVLDRRAFLRKSSRLVGCAAAGALLPVFQHSNAKAEMVPKNDPRIAGAEIKYPGPSGDVRAYWARPKGEGKLPGVIVVHEKRGLVPHIQDVTRRVALEGFLAMAPDALSPLGGTPEDESKGPAMIQTLDAPSNLRVFLAAVRYLKTHPASTGQVGVVGFCWGGAMANQLAVNSPDLLAVVPYYGRQPAAEEVPRITAALLLHYAGLDEGINRGIPAYEAALKQAGIQYQIYMYERAQHAFNNDTNAERYNKEAADLAWQRTIAFFKQKLRT